MSNSAMTRHSGAWQWHSAAFYRRDDQLVDWTFQNGVIARTANPVNLDTAGAEAR